MSLLAHVRTDLARLQVHAAPTVVAVSGGADSLALFHALLRLRDAGILVVAHFNHGLRRAESDGDEEFVRKTCEDATNSGIREIEFRCERTDVAARTATEGGARQSRYDWLATIAQEFHVSQIATGHTADDQAETVLHRLLRGSGLRGLRGIAPRRELRPGVELIRPMLSATHAEILAFLNEIGQPFREDCSNADVRFTRNRLRHGLLPQLAREYNPQIHATLARLADQAADAFAEIESQANAILKHCELPPAGKTIILDRIKLAEVPRHLLRETLRVLWQREQWPCDGMRFADWDRTADVVFGETTAVDLPGRVHVRGRGRVVQLGMEAR
jgi:tRNA(Ile)-lysidine synthase